MSLGARRDSGPPCPDVALGATYARRLGRLVVRLAASRERAEGAGAARRFGAGEEFIGYRPYRNGEDSRRLDWGLFARLDRPYVRVTRREAAEHWAVWLDASASMGVGPPGKLQAAAELAGALAALGLRFGATVELVASAPDGPRRAQLRGHQQLARLLRFLEDSHASGRSGLAQLLERRPAAGCGRLFLIGDLLDIRPGEIARLLTPGRELGLVSVLAPDELAPPCEGQVRWRDPEGAGHRSVHLDAALTAHYEGRLKERLDGWQRIAAHHAVSFVVHEAGAAFEDGLQALLGVH